MKYLLAIVLCLSAEAYATSPVIVPRAPVVRPVPVIPRSVSPSRAIRAPIIVPMPVHTTPHKQTNDNSPQVVKDEPSNAAFWITIGVALFVVGGIGLWLWDHK